MTGLDPFAALGTVDRKKRNPEEAKPKPSGNPSNQMGQHPLELNQFWKEGGSGLPPTQPAWQAKLMKQAEYECFLHNLVSFLYPAVLLCRWSLFPLFPLFPLS